MSTYRSKHTNSNGLVNYTDEENETWQILIDRQQKIVQTRACDEFLTGIEKLAFPQDRIPQCEEITNQLQKATGWSVQPVASLITLKEFFSLLANKHFPAATFIRKRDELDYLKEPDIFHEFFGHCPLLTHQAYADFLEWYGKTALQASKEIQSILGRLFWFTIEFGLLQTKQGLRIYGGGILSSYQETIYALEDAKPKREVLRINEVLNTPYRYDIIQDRYFILNSFDALYQIQHLDIQHLATLAYKGELKGDDFIIC